MSLVLPWEEVEYFGDKVIQRKCIGSGGGVFNIYRIKNNTYCVYTETQHYFNNLEDAKNTFDKYIQQTGWIIVSKERAEKLRLLL